MRRPFGRPKLSSSLRRTSAAFATGLLEGFGSLAFVFGSVEVVRPGGFDHDAAALARDGRRAFDRTLPQAGAVAPAERPPAK